MPVAYDPDTQAALESGRVATRDLILFDFGSGLYGFWNGVGVFTYNGVDYKSAGSLIQVSPVRSSLDLSAQRLEVRLSSRPNTALTPEVLSDIWDEVYHFRPVTLMLAFFDIDTRALLSVESVGRGYIDRVEAQESQNQPMALVFDIESRFRIHQRSNYRVRSDADQKRILSTDTGLRHVAKVGTERVLVGRIDSPPEQPRKKNWLQRLFGM